MKFWYIPGVDNRRCRSPVCGQDITLAGGGGQTKHQDLVRPALLVRLGLTLSLLVNISHHAWLVSTSKLSGNKHFNPINVWILLSQSWNYTVEDRDAVKTTFSSKVYSHRLLSVRYSEIPTMAMLDCSNWHKWRIPVEILTTGSLGVQRDNTLLAGHNQSGSQSAGNHREPGPEPRDDRGVHRRKELPRFPQCKSYRGLRH